MAQVARVVVDSTCAFAKWMCEKSHLSVQQNRVFFGKTVDFNCLRYSWYYTSTTVTSIGYGDISPQNPDERQGAKEEMLKIYPP